MESAELSQGMMSGKKSVSNEHQALKSHSLLSDTSEINMSRINQSNQMISPSQYTRNQSHMQDQNQIDHDTTAGKIFSHNQKLLSQAQ